MVYKVLENAVLTQLGQLRPANTSAASIFTTGTQQIAWATTLIIANLTGTDAYFSVFHDIDGTTYNESTAVAFVVKVEANGVVEWNFDNYLPLPKANGSIGVQSDTANALNFTLNGLLRSTS